MFKPHVLFTTSVTSSAMVASVVLLPMVRCPGPAQVVPAYGVLGGITLAQRSEEPGILSASERFSEGESSFQQFSQSYLVNIATKTLLPSAKSSADRFDRLQIFGPIDPDFQFRPKVKSPAVHPTMIWKTIAGMRAVGGFGIYVDVARKYFQHDSRSTLALLAAGLLNINNYCLHIQSIGFGKIIGKPQSFNIPALFCENSLYQQTIEFALEVLEQDNLRLKERIWALGILRTLQAHLPKGELKPVRTNVQEGLVCRGALELWLTRVLAQALRRAELFVKLQGYLNVTKRSEMTREFINIYDTLLQESCLIPERKLSDLIKECAIHMMKKDSPQGEVICIFHIINHLEKHNKSVKLKSWRAKFIYEGFKKSFEYQEKLGPLIRGFLEGGIGDFYMENLVLPLIRWDKVTMKHYEYVLESFKGYEHDLAHMDHQTLQKYPSMEDYQESKIAVMEILEKALDYIKDDKNHMNGGIPVAGVDKQKEEDKTPCAICWNDFVNGQKVDWIYAEVKTPEKFTPTCPLCRKDIQYPIPRMFHLFWYNPEISARISQPSISHDLADHTS
ncbi:uncharacterized protein MELLADRAFT_107121 [Melampsora larici-populina 98AG31]|uniref:Secreted protein n=1 Tax=Melampsora larici-populina (strain 98AG31 / pathotype 3-4-7) TaxID=747676 RepID=F4RNR4_MELLP|nr:uncharacterized protein MELLADRAFT_107121 [Melampsora larici-populina 98AG31]EGG06048.1 hypothetical protein MELLADRAFT_107121 [Melampsora larici-populina 98AG31]